VGEADRHVTLDRSTLGQGEQLSRELDGGHMKAK
jgi:hypothetical protein